MLTSVGTADVAASIRIATLVCYSGQSRSVYARRCRWEILPEVRSSFLLTPATIAEKVHSHFHDVLGEDSNATVTRILVGPDDVL